MKAVLLILFFSLHAAHAADIVFDSIPELQSDEYIDKAPDLKLKAIDEHNVEHHFSLHSEVLMNSKLFRLQFGLGIKDSPLEESYTFHIQSIDDLKLVLRLLYGTTFKSGEFAYFKKIVVFQERFQLSNFNAAIMELLKYHLLLNLPAEDLADVLKMMSLRYSELAGSISDFIFQFIALNHKAHEQYSREHFLVLLKGYEEIIFYLEVAISGKEGSLGTEKEGSSGTGIVYKRVHYDQKIYDKAKKIQERFKIRGTEVSVFRSHTETKQVMIILKNKYGIQATLLDRAVGLKSKYKISLS